MTWELDFLHALQGLHSGPLDAVMVFITHLGDAGIFWIVLSLVLLIYPKTRKCGCTMALAMIFTLLLGNVLIKNLVARLRPFQVDDTVSLIIKAPGEYSFPSGHTANGFSAAFVLWYYYRKAGIAFLLLAAFIAFSRLYLFVHFPTDILGGFVLALLDASLAILLVRFWEKRKKQAVEE